ncbi:hypothetical protein C2S52_013991 [Perilla frutescens var. hirtella]|nr:hypothetical protein C2S52_013991 [Perilla frutescens var. hirtella]
MSDEFKKLSAEQRERRMKNMFPHRLSRRGYAGLVEIMKNELCGDDEIDRAIMWKKARVLKDEEIKDENLKKTVENIDEYIRQKEEGLFIPDGNSDDLLTQALEKPEHPGCVRAVGHHVTPTTYFKKPNEKRHDTKKEYLLELTEGNDKKKVKCKVVKNMKVKSATSLPAPLKMLCSYADHVLRDGTSILVKLDDVVFSSERECYIHSDDIFPFCALEPISGNCILVYIWHLYTNMKKDNTRERFRFLDPFHVSYMGKNDHVSERARVLSTRLVGASSDQLVLAPCNVGEHWILTIIAPYEEVVYLLDPISHHLRDETWKQVVNLAIAIFNSNLGKKGKKNPTWEVIKFGKGEYSKNEIDEVRSEWALCVQEHL